MGVTSIRFAEDENGDYHSVSREKLAHLVHEGTLELEGVDGDEEANTVTYWYKRKVEE